jgi:alpha-glucosidase (family GH31 glycosyl hydrolase)
LVIVSCFRNYLLWSRFVRWIQWGSFSAVMRSHDRGMSAGLCADVNLCNIVRVWEVPNKYFEANRLALQVRATLLPYIYTTYRQAFDTGLSPLRPMYYDFPEFDEAYTAASPDGSMAQVCGACA